MSADTPDFEIIPGECVVIEGVEYTFNALSPLAFVPGNAVTIEGREFAYASPDEILRNITPQPVTLADIDALALEVDQAWELWGGYVHTGEAETRKVIAAFLDKYGIAHEAVG